jgi:hypothetical protein
VPLGVSHSGYPQINTSNDEEEKSAFNMSFGIFYCTKMLFGLKNVGATYHKCVHIILEQQNWRNVEAYTDDTVVKSKKCGDLLDELGKTVTPHVSNPHD